MNTRPQRDRGFTLIELVMATVLSGIIGGVLVAAIATSLRVASSTTDQIADSTDTALISTFLFRDAQAAGATDPSTARIDTAVGVSTSNTSSGWAGCSQPGQLVVRLSWIDHDADSVDERVVITYALHDGHLTRRACQDGAGVDVVVGNNIASAAARCAPDASCGGLVESVSLRFRGSASTSAAEHTLTASLRPGAQQLPDIDGSARVPLVVLGGPAETMPCPIVTLGADSAVAVVGDAVVASECGTAPVGGKPGSLVHTLGATRTLSGLTDPFARVEPPTTACGASETTSVDPTATADDRSGATFHRDPVVISGAVEMAPGTHVFCAGLDIRGGASVTGTDVFLFVLGGTFSVDRAASVSLAAPMEGPYENLLVWVATSQDVTIGGDSISRYLGHVYAPTSDVVVDGAAPTMLGGAVSRRIEFIGDGPVRVGLPIPVITVEPSSIPSGQVGVAYAATTLRADGGQQPYTWSASGLPPGVTLAASSGVLSGAPTQPGTYDVVVTALDASAAATAVSVDVQIDEALSITGPELLPDGQVAVPFPTTLLATAGGTDPVAWTSSELPGGLVLDPLTGVLSGTPTLAGSFPVTVTATDARSATVSKTYTSTVRAQLAVATASLPNGQVFVGYPATPLSAVGGTPPTTWSATGLPPGLGVGQSGALTGTPTTPGTFTIVVQVTDAISAEATTTYTVTIAPQLGVATMTLPGGQVGVSYPATDILATGGTPPFAWSAIGLPPGLTIDGATGTVVGTPTEPGTPTVAIEVTDATGTTSAASYSIVIDASLAIAGPATLPAGQVGLAYVSTPVSSSGGTSSYAWAGTGLPPGLTIDATTGVISGDPAAAGTFQVVVSVTDSVSAVATVRYDMVVVARLSITTATLPDGKLGLAYPAFTLVAEGGRAPVTWSASGLPPGLTIASATGEITGSPSAVGTSNVVMAVTDVAGAHATRSFSVTIASSVPPGCPVAPSGWRGEYFIDISLTGDPKICRDDPSINFSWGSGSPGSGVPVDNYSARWTRTQGFVGGSYTFAVGSDDGSRLYIDGVLVLDRWVDQGYPSPVPEVRLDLTAGQHLIVMEYFERTGSARATLTWEVDPQSIPCTSSATAWKGEYFSNATLSGPATVCRSEANIDFNWGTGSPSRTIPSDKFSARWTRTLGFTAGTYTFALGSDDGSRLYIDGVLVLDRWTVQSYPNPIPTVDRSLAAGSHTIVVEYYENSGDARATLGWTKRSNGVTVARSTGGDHRYYGENRIALANTATITAMTVTIIVDRTTDLADSGMWTDFPSDALKLTRKTTGDSITYTFDLKSNRTVDAGSRTLVAQTSGKGTLHPTSGDTWTVVTTASGVTDTVSGTF